jgi:hypothetical protein
VPVGSDDSPTRGQGLAAGADLPAGLAELMAARADVLERHTLALDPSDPGARSESDAYADPARMHREVARDLAGLARQFPAAGRDLRRGAATSPWAATT